MTTIRSAYLAPLGLEAQLRQEVPGFISFHGQLLCSSEPAIPSRWAQNIWLKPELIPIGSIKQAANELKRRQRSWWPYVPNLHRRSQLIQEQLARVSDPRACFLEAPASQPLGSWTLLDAQTLLASPACSSRRPQGAWEFQEDKEGPPNRAYLKLWELFTRLQLVPKPGANCVDIGAAPGGWTWALAKLGVQVEAWDRSSLAPKVAALAGVKQVQGDAFKVSPQSHPMLDWLVSDIVCYPPKLFAWLQSWLTCERPRNIVCTIKFQGGEHYEYIDKFAAIPDSQIVHLYHNKHELTWYCLRDEASLLRL